MNRQIIRLLFRMSILISMLLSINGCWDIRYLDQINIVSGMAMDAAGEQKELIKLTVQVIHTTAVANTNQSTTGTGSTVTSYSAVGKTVFEAIRKMSAMTSRKLFFSHNKLLVISDELARKGIDPLIELIDRDSEMRVDYNVLIAKGVSAEKILQTTTSIDSIPAHYIQDMSTDYEDLMGGDYSLDIRRLITKLSTNKVEATIGSILLIGNAKQAGETNNIDGIKPKAQLKIGPLAIFRGDKLIGFLNQEQTRGLAWATNKMKNTPLLIPCQSEDKKIALEVKNSQTRTKVAIKKNKPVMSVFIKQKAIISEIQCEGVNIESSKELNRLTDMASREVVRIVEHSIEELQRRETDATGFGLVVYRQKPGYWQQNHKNWPKLFAKLEVHVEVETKIVGSGIRNQSYIN